MSTEFAVFLAGLMGFVLGSLITAIVAIVIFRPQRQQDKLLRRQQEEMKRKLRSIKPLSPFGFMRISNTLEEAYNAETLARMLRVYLDLKLTHISSLHKTFPAIVLDVIGFFERRVRIDELIDGIYQGNSADELVGALHREYSENPDQFFRP